jgi:hypothetical protein
MKAVLGPRFAVAVVLVLVSLTGCCSSLGTGGGSKPTYIIVPAGTPIPGHPGQVTPSQ